MMHWVCLGYHLVGRLVGWLDGVSVGWSVGWLAGVSVGWSVGYSPHRSVHAVQPDEGESVLRLTVR